MEKTQRSHVVAGDLGRLQCNHCGESYAISMPVPMSIYLASLKAFADEHADCREPPDVRCSTCLRLGHTYDRCVELNVTTPEQWIRSGDTGISSVAIWRHMQGMAAESTWGPSPPLDPADFGRCHRLLAKFPEWRARIGEMARYPGWGPLVGAWGELEALYVEEKASGTGERLYAEMCRLRGEQ